MSHDVFICYSSHDKAVADASCAMLETNKVRCWIAPRDVVPGSEYGEAIINAINDCKILVIVFSAKANESVQVRREVERAVSKGKIILPLRIEAILPSGAMEFALSNTHWLDALTPPIEAHIKQLCKAISSLLTENAPQIPKGEAFDMGYQHGLWMHTLQPPFPKLESFYSSIGMPPELLRASDILNNFESFLEILRSRLGNERIGVYRWFMAGVATVLAANTLGSSVSQEIKERAMKEYLNHLRNAGFSFQQSNNIVDRIVTMFQTKDRDSATTGVYELAKEICQMANALDATVAAKNEPDMQATNSKPWWKRMSG